MAHRWLLPCALVATGCGGFSGGYPGPAAVRAFPIGDCDADGVEDYATALLYDDYCDPHPSDEMRVVSGKSGALLAQAELGFSARHTPHVLWAGAGLQALALLDRRHENPPAPRPLVRIGCAGPTDLLTELGHVRSDQIIGLGLRSAMDGDGVFVVVCSRASSSAGTATCVLYRWSQGKALELKHYAFQAAELSGGLACMVGQFEGDSALDLAIGEPGKNSSAGAIHLIDGGSGVQRVLLEATIARGCLGARIDVLRSTHAEETEWLVLSATDGKDPGRGRGVLFACSPASPNERIWSVDGTSDFSDIDREVQILPDCDGDGLEDVGYIDERDESAVIVSGRTGSRITRISHAPWQKIESIVPCTDCDGDGRSDLLLSVRPNRDPDSAPDPLDRHFTGCVVVSSADRRSLRRFPLER